VIDVVRFDHISIAVPEMDPQIELLERLFGFRFSEKFESDEGFFGANLDVPGRSGLGWEVIAPNGPDSYLHRFLKRPGAGLHHVTIQVRSADQAVEALRAEGVEPWGLRQDDDEPREVLYIHPRSGGHGFLFQLYEGEPWHDGVSFEDMGDHTLGIVAVNHLSHAHPSRGDLGDWYERVFGMETVHESPAGEGAGFVTRVLETPTRQLRFEILEPAGAGSFVQRFLDQRGPSMHHVTFEVGDWARAIAACEHHGVPVFGVRHGETRGVKWSEAFIHPRHTGGMLVQFFWQAEPGVWI
jgi:4-hydroxyphenylpyruvate dioxygenase-like putative hemolysin